MFRPDFTDVLAAQARIRPYIRRTPLVESRILDDLVRDHKGRGKVWLKPESLQLTGSFKARGALSRVTAMSDAERKHGVVAFSSGNHAQGVAYAAQQFALPATIVMPSDAPAIKVARTRALGAEIIFYDRAREDRAAIAGQVAAQSGATLIPPFDDAYVIAGQGTAGLEIAEDLGEKVPDIFICCCGGGGLAAGTTLALRNAYPAIEIVIVEPEHYDDMTRSLVADERLSIQGYEPTLCDALQTPKPGELTFPILQQARARGLVVTEADVKAAMRFAFDELKLLIEPGGVVALAALLANQAAFCGKDIVVMLSGGNVEASLFAQILNGSPDLLLKRG